MQYFRAAASALLTVCLASCASIRNDSPDPPAEITKVKYFHLEQGKRYTAADRSISFEPQYYLHGAVTAEERRARYGHYYNIFWRLDDASRPVTVRFEYRQKLTGPEVRVIDAEIADPNRRNRTMFTVTGDPYHTNGTVTAWRVSVVREGETLASDQSFLWE